MGFEPTTFCMARLPSDAVRHQDYGLFKQYLG
jgi:hypothetical protein